MNQITQNNVKTIFLFFSCLYFLSTKAQTVTTLAGSTQGFANGIGTVAQFNYPSGVAVDNAGNIYVADSQNYRVRKITPDGGVTTFAGSTYGTSDGTGTTAQFFAITDVAIDVAGNIFVSDLNRIRKITPTGVVSTIAGSIGAGGFVNGTGTAAKFNNLQSIALDATGNIYVADRDNDRIRKITPAGVVTTFAGSTAGFQDGTGTSAKFSYPCGVTVDTNGNVYVADTWNDRIRKITPTGVVTTLAGSTNGYIDATGTAAKFQSPSSVTADTAGNIFVADYNRIRKITSTAEVTTLAGSTQGYLDGIGTVAQFSNPIGIAIVTDGTIYIADSYNNRIRKITNALSIPNFQLENQVSLYPNPASTFINIELEDITANRYSILDINGKILQSEKILDNKTTINISNLDSGIYFMHITTDKGKVSKKVVKL